MTRADERRHKDVDSPESAWARRLRARYDDVAQEPLPGSFRELVERLQDADLRHRRTKARTPQARKSSVAPDRARRSVSPR
jgi:hypothetical protein